MRVSIIIPALNEAANIALAVERAFAAGGYEVIVVDCESSDDTARLAREAGAIVVVSSPGRARQQNAGANVASGKVLLFSHADTWLEEHAIEQIRHMMSDTVEGSATKNCWGAFQQQIEAPGGLYRWLEWGNAARVRWRGIAYGDQGIWIRRQLFQDLRGFPETKLLEDLLLSKQLSRVASPLLLPGPLHVSARRWQRHGVIRQTFRNWGILAAYACGVSPDRLATFYRRHDR